MSISTSSQMATLANPSTTFQFDDSIAYAAVGIQRIAFHCAQGVPKVSSIACKVEPQLSDNRLTANIAMSLYDGGTTNLLDDTSFIEVACIGGSAGSLFAKNGLHLVVNMDDAAGWSKVEPLSSDPSQWVDFTLQGFSMAYGTFDHKVLIYPLQNIMLQLQREPMPDKVQLKGLNYIHDNNLLPFSQVNKQWAGIIQRLGSQDLVKVLKKTVPVSTVEPMSVDFSDVLTAGEKLSKAVVFLQQLSIYGLPGDFKAVRLGVEQVGLNAEGTAVTLVPDIHFENSVGEVLKKASFDLCVIGIAQVGK